MVIKPVKNKVIELRTRLFTIEKRLDNLPPGYQIIIDQYEPHKSATTIYDEDDRLVFESFQKVQFENNTTYTASNPVPVTLRPDKGFGMAA